MLFDHTLLMHLCVEQRDTDIHMIAHCSVMERRRPTLILNITIGFPLEQQLHNLPIESNCCSMQQKALICTQYLAVPPTSSAMQRTLLIL